MRIGVARGVQRGRHEVARCRDARLVEAHDRHAFTEEQRDGFAQRSDLRDRRERIVALADHGLARVPEQALERRVDLGDAAFTVHAQDRVLGGLQQACVQFVRGAQFFHSPGFIERGRQ